MRFALLIAAALAFPAPAAVVGSLDGNDGAQLRLTDEHTNCPEKFDAFIVNADGSIRARGCWFFDEDHDVAMDWDGFGRRYWPAARINWAGQRKRQNGPGA